MTDEHEICYADEYPSDEELDLLDWAEELGRWIHEVGERTAALFRAAMGR